MNQLNFYDVNRWFSLDEAAKYLFGAEYTSEHLHNFLLNNELSLTCRVRENITLQITDATKLGMFNSVFKDASLKPKAKMRFKEKLFTDEVTIHEHNEFEFYIPIARYGIEATLMPGFYEVESADTDSIQLKLSNLTGKCFLVNDTNSIEDYFDLGILDTELLEFDPEPTLTKHEFLTNHYKYENKTGSLNSTTNIKKSTSLEMGITRLELDRFINVQTNPTIEIKTTQEKQSEWKTKAQNRADELSFENPTWLKKQVAMVIFKEFEEQHIFDDRGKKIPDYETIYKNIKIKTARRK